MSEASKPTRIRPEPYNGAERVGLRRFRSPIDGILRYRCSCGRLIAEDPDWSDINEGERDDLCWGFYANHELDLEVA